MATISKRIQPDGTVRYQAQVRIMRDGEKVFSKSRTFNKHAHAKRWAADLEAELDKPGGLAKATHRGVTFKKVIEDYLARGNFGRTKEWDMRAMTGMAIAEKDVLKMRPADFIRHIEWRRQSVQASTANGDMEWIKSAWRHGRLAMGLPLDASVPAAAAEYCRAEGLIGRTRKRDRRPTAAELEALTAYFEGRNRSDYPMADIMWFAVHSARRQSEITRLEWADNEGQTGLVRDAKHPRHKEGNHRRFIYSDEAWEIVQRQPRVSELIFPYTPKTIGAYFTRACAVLEIKNLRFHDLRHEATSRYFEQGMRIVEVQQRTLHEDWNTLRRYTHLRPENSERT